MIRRGGPVWLARPSRFVAVERRTARWLLAALVLALLLAAVGAYGTVAAYPTEPLHDALFAAMRHGAGFYDAWADMAQSDLATRDAIMLPPTLAVATVALPVWVSIAAMALTVTAILWIGAAGLSDLFARDPARWIAVVLLAIGSAGAALLWAGAPHAGWATLLVALAVLWRPGRIVEPAALVCIAAVIDPAALWAVAVLMLLAIIDSSRREVVGWLIAGLVAAAVLAAHRHALAGLGVVAAPDLPEGSSAAARLMLAALPGVPSWLAAPLLLLGALGWAGLSHPLGLRVVALLAVGVLAEGWFGLHPATLAAALVAPGIALVPDALADLVRAAADPRRFTVTRITKREVEG
ncbi:MAG: hypothetical protein PGN23_09605 [Sphingomonas adhaesiva]|uniref:hypothetical protein n=1 Tax=Sphingomonas adhaesiva TaxID=28212 RepID=UPI002FFC879D